MRFMCDFLAMIYMTVITLICFIVSCRIHSMTFKTFSKKITIKNKKLAAMLIAEKTTWGTTTSAKKRNEMSLLGVFSYAIFMLEIIFLIYDWYVFIKTGVVERCSEEKTYLVIVVWYYCAGLFIKIKEAEKFKKGKI